MDFIKKIKLYSDLFRVQQWTKNGFVFAAVIFSGKFLELTVLYQSIFACIIFCLLASAIYIINDIVDRNNDAAHPIKKLRPITSNKISILKASAIAFVLLFIAFLSSYFLNHVFFIFTLLYLALNISYSLILKKIVIIDVLAVAANYMIRILAGAAVIQVSITPWFLIASTFLAIFLALGKRKHELTLLGAYSKNHRSILSEYDQYFLDQLITITSSSTIIIYSLYTFDQHTKELLHTEYMPYTIPFVLFGVFRYLYIIHRKESGGNPAEILLHDPSLLMTVVLWIGTIVTIITTSN